MFRTVLSSEMLKPLAYGAINRLPCRRAKMQALPLISRSPMNMDEGGRKQYLASYQKKSQMECLSVEDIKARLPLENMVCPYATRLVKGNSSAVSREHKAYSLESCLQGCEGRREHSHSFLLC